VTALAFDTEKLAQAGFPALGRRFVLWRTFPPRRPGGKPVKLPCTPAGCPVDGTDEGRWLDFDRAAALASECRRGLGVALGWGLGGLDLDRCRAEDGTLTDRSRRLLRYFTTYVEVSPSKTGVKAYFLAGPEFRSTAKVDAKGIELYAGRRFFALTGRPLPGAAIAIADCTTAARTLAGVLRPPTPPRQPQVPGPPSADAWARLRDCEPIRERPAHLGGTIFTLRRCPFTNDEHPGGGSFAIMFTDGGIHFRCDRTVHGPLRHMHSPAGAPRRTHNYRR
jgi:hypothetical protein